MEILVRLLREYEPVPLAPRGRYTPFFGLGAVQSHLITPRIKRWPKESVRYQSNNKGELSVVRGSSLIAWARVVALPIPFQRFNTR